MIGKIYITVFKYYDKNIKSMNLKNRPILVIGKADKDDYIALPISTIPLKQNIDSNYDICLTVNEFPNTKLNKTSYVRTHKVTTLHRGELIKEVSNLKLEYPDLFFTIMSRVNEYHNKIINNYIETI